MALLATNRLPLTLQTKPLAINAYYSVRDYVGDNIIRHSESKLATIKKCVVQQYESLGILPDDNETLPI